MDGRAFPTEIRMIHVGVLHPFSLADGIVREDDNPSFNKVQYNRLIHRMTVRLFRVAGRIYNCRTRRLNSLRYKQRRGHVKVRSGLIQYVFHPIIVTLHDADTAGVDHYVDRALDGSRELDSHPAALDTFFEAVTAGDPPAHCTFEEAAHTQRIMDAIYRSEAAGRAVEPDPA